jgi:hypothetical protein
LLRYFSTVIIFNTRPFDPNRLVFAKSLVDPFDIAGRFFDLVEMEMFTQVVADHQIAGSASFGKQ